MTTGLCARLRKNAPPELVGAYDLIVELLGGPLADRPAAVRSLTAAKAQLASFLQQHQQMHITRAEQMALYEREETVAHTLTQLKLNQRVGPTLLGIQLASPSSAPSSSVTTTTTAPSTTTTTTTTATATGTNPGKEKRHIDSDSDSDNDNK